MGNIWSCVQKFWDWIDNDMCALPLVLFIAIPFKLDPSHVNATGPAFCHCWTQCCNQLLGITTEAQTWWMSITCYKNSLGIQWHDSCRRPNLEVLCVHCGGLKCWWFSVWRIRTVAAIYVGHFWHRLPLVYVARITLGVSCHTFCSCFNYFCVSYNKTNSH